MVAAAVCEIGDWGKKMTRGCGGWASRAIVAGLSRGIVAGLSSGIGAGGRGRGEMNVKNNCKTKSELKKTDDMCQLMKEWLIKLGIHGRGSCLATLIL